MTNTLFSSHLTRIMAAALCAAFAGLTSAPVPAAFTDLGAGFKDHGVATPISNHRGLVATVDGAGRNVVLLWLMDYRGGYGLLMIDAETGKADQFPMPFPPPGESVDSPYSSILSSKNKFYTHIKNRFVEFDPVKRAFTFCSEETTPWFAMGMTEDDNGVIWSVTYPQSGVVSFNPKTREFRDYGEAYQQNWKQYQRYVAADDAGWIYFAVGNTASQIIALDPVTGKAKPMLKEEERQKGSAYVYRDMDGKVYGQAKEKSEGDWIEFYKGEGKKIGEHPKLNPKPIITYHQGLFHKDFPDGKRIKTCDLVERKLVVENPGTGKTHEVSFDYTSEGAHIMGVATASDGTICGGTAFPMRFFRYDPKTDSLLNRQAYGQWNEVLSQGGLFFVAGYPGGYLLEWDPSKPWVNTDEKDAQSNPLFLLKVSPEIHRPSCLLVTADNRTIVMGGTPQYGYTGGGLLFWDRKEKNHALLKDTDVVPDQSTRSMISLPGGKLLAGTTTNPGTGGEKKANESELYIMDMETKRMEWHAPLLPGVQDYTDMIKNSAGLIYGFADRKIFFVFDPKTRAIIHKHDMEGEFGETPSQQGTRVFVAGPEGVIYVLFLKGIAQIDQASHKLNFIVKSPVPIEVGGDYLDRRIYFAKGSHLYSCDLGKKIGGQTP
ncbi:hypothetical protein JW926_11765 [Candidatus Sumerlaeota bacterium]|nr:hypothetical protein [Candidatus Sumerlaeota bacterium]